MGFYRPGVTSGAGPPMCTYLVRRGAIYYFRRVIPNDLQAAFGGRREWVYSLKTKDRAEGKRRAQDATTESNRLITEAYSEYEASEIVSPVRIFSPIPKPETVAAARANTRLRALFNAYVSERQPSPSTVRGWQPVLEHLISYLGHDDAARIRTTDLIGWKEHLLVEPGRTGKLRSLRTIGDVYIAAIKVVLGWAADNQCIPNNPATAVKVRAPKRVRLRDPGFSRDEALTILRTSLKPSSDNLTREHALARRWVPWLCAYTGARVNELSQLRAEDVQKIDGKWAIRITPEAGTVKNGAVRIVPLHPHLIEQGFPAVAITQGKGPIFYAPSRQRKAGAESRHYKKVGERLAAWVRSIGIDDPAVLPNHGWRHMFKTTARLVSMDPDARDVIQGHALKTEGQKYGSFPISVLAAAIEKLPRFDVPGLPELQGSAVPEPQREAAA